MFVETAWLAQYVTVREFHALTLLLASLCQDHWRHETLKL